jgi:hypothetical protein
MPTVRPAATGTEKMDDNKSLLLLYISFGIIGMHSRCMPIIPALGRLRQEDGKFQASETLKKKKAPL